MTTQIYFYKDEVQCGPITINEFTTLYTNGDVDLNTLVWMDSMTEWMIFADSPIYSQIQTAICPPPPISAPSIDVKSRSSVRFVTESIDYRKSIRQKSTRQNNNKNSSSQRTVSQRLTRSSRFDASKKIWIEDPNEAWVLGSIIHQDNTLLAVENLHTKEKFILDTGFKDVFVANDKVVSDMASLNYMHEPGILYNLEQRFLSSLPYTYMGLVLLAVNPFRYLPQPSPNDFIMKSLNPDQPHPYAIAELCCQALNLKNSLNQSVVISGESGSGKTETAKLVLHHLVNRSGGDNNHNNNNGHLINTRLLQSSPLLEAFGNSKTSRNPNSSRFGKFMKIFLTNTSPPQQSQQRQIEGAVIETYLLEKSRVINQAANEQNFHIFYQLLASFKSLSKILPLHMFSNYETSLEGGVYRIVNSSCQTSLEILQNNFIETNTALQVIGYDEDRVSDVWKILGSLLLYGNLHFIEEDTAEGGVAVLDSDSQQVCLNACQLLGLSSMSTVVEMFTQKSMTTRGEKFTLRLTVNDACYARDAFCKTIYESLFMDIVNSINHGLTSPHTTPTQQQRHEHKQYIGVLDVFGFECFDINGFDQLLINYANESLQHTFNTQVFQSELLLYLEEGIDCPLHPSSCPDNTPCIEMLWSFKSTNTSILNTLDAICRQPKPTDSKFCSQLHKEVSKNHSQKYFPAPHPKDKQKSFLVKHFAGLVKYTVGGSTSTSSVNDEDKVWVDRNNDSMPDSLWTVLSQSSSQLIQKLVQINSNLLMTNSRKQINKPTVSTLFSKSIQSLTQQLQSTSCSFIRCLKPNSTMNPLHFDKKYVVEQMRALGLVQACEVMSVGLPHRLSYLDLKESLGQLTTEIEEIFQNEPEEVLISALLRCCSVSEDTYRLGKTRIFFRSGKLSILEKNIFETIEKGEKREEMMRTMREVKTIRESLVQSLQENQKKLKECEKKQKLVEKEVREVQNTSGSTTVVSDQSRIAEITHQLTMKMEELRSQISTSLDNVQKVGIELQTPSLGKNSPQEALHTQLSHTKMKLSHLQTHLSTLESQLVFIENSVRNTSLSRCDEETEMDRWQGLQQLEELLFVAKKLVKDAELTSLKFQIQPTHEILKKCDAQFSAIHEFSDTLLRDLQNQQAQRSQNQINSLQLISKCEEELQNIEKLELSCQEIFQDCENILKGHHKLQTEERQQREREQREREEEEKRRVRNEEARRREEEEEEIARVAILERRNKEPIETTIPSQTQPEPDHQPEPQPDHQPEPQPELTEVSRRGSIRISKSMMQKLSFSKTSGGVIKTTPSLSSSPSSPSSSSSSSPSCSATTREEKETSKKETEPEIDLKRNEIETPVVLEPLPQIDTWVLPEGWEEFYDSGEGLPYYFNTITQQTQWERPEGPASSQGGELLPIEEKIIESTSTITEIQPDLLKIPIVDTSHGCQQEVTIKPNKCTLNYGRITTTQLNSFGTEVKSGYLMKRSAGLMGRWKKKFFVLEGAILSYFEKSTHYTYGSGGGKEMRLSTSSSTSFTDTECTFIVKSPKSITDEEISWMLVAETPSSMREWVAYINAHIHSLHCRVLEPQSYSKKTETIKTTEKSGMSTSVEEVTQKSTFWSMLPSCRNPVGVRSLPRADGPRTGEGIYPGEYVEIVQIIESSSNVYLKLAEDRGWVFTTHPTQLTELFVQFTGYIYHELTAQYRVDQSVIEGIPIQFSPGNDAPPTGSSLNPKEVVTICGIWELTIPVAQQRQQWCKQFGKLSDGRGWVPMTSPRGEILIHPILGNSLK